VSREAASRDGALTKACGGIYQSYWEVSRGGWDILHIETWHTIKPNSNLHRKIIDTERLLVIVKSCKRMQWPGLKIDVCEVRPRDMTWPAPRSRVNSVSIPGYVRGIRCVLCSYWNLWS
jgi:hypothetical protein